MSLPPEKTNRIAVSIDEACEISSSGRTRLFEAINKGLLPAKKFGRRTLILVSDLETFLAGLPNVIEPDTRPPPVHVGHAPRTAERRDAKRAAPRSFLGRQP